MVLTPYCPVGVTTKLQFLIYYKEVWIQLHLVWALCEYLTLGFYLGSCTGTWGTKETGLHPSAYQ